MLLVPRDAASKNFRPFSSIRFVLCHNSLMAKTVGRWVVYERQDGGFVYLSKPLKTRAQAEHEREKLNAKYPRAAIGVGFIRTTA